MDPIPSVSWAFSLLLQEEQQRAIGSFPSITSVCSHCNIIGHIVDKCYKVHGYPPGYKTKQQQCSTNSNPSPTNTRNLVVVQQIDSTNVTKYWWCYFAMSDYFESVAILTLCCLSDWILFHFIYLTWCSNKNDYRKEWRKFYTTNKSTLRCSLWSLEHVDGKFS